MVKERCWLLDAFKGAFSDSCYSWKTKMSLGCLGFVLFYFFFWNCYLCNVFSIFTWAFCRTVGKMLSKQKRDLIIVAKLCRGTLGAVFSPCSSAVYGHFVMQRVQALFMWLSPSLTSLKKLTESFTDHKRLRKCKELYFFIHILK